MSLLVRGARILGEEAADLLIRQGRIAAVGQGLDAGDAEVLDADGLVALPGLVDLHVHLRQPGQEQAETVATGSAAAAAGGFTAVFAMANTTPVQDTAEVVERVLDLGVEAGLCEVRPVGAVSVGIAGAEVADIRGMAASRAAVRLFSDDGRCTQDARVMRAAMRLVAEVDGVVSQHSQDFDLAPTTACCHESDLSCRLGLQGWPDVAEEVIVARDVQLAKDTGARLHVAHVTTPGALDVVRWAKSRGLPVTAEVTPHHLMLDHELLAGLDPVYKVNPPLRPVSYAEDLRDALADGTIDVVATDHAPHPAASKAKPFPEAAFGMLGIETALPVVATLFVRTGRMTWRDVARVMSAAPARIGRLAGQGGQLAEGAPAHLTFVDPDRAATIDRDASRSLSRNNPWHGRELTGGVDLTVFGGRVTHRAGRFA